MDEVYVKKVHVQPGMGDRLVLRNVIQENMHGYFISQEEHTANGKYSELMQVYNHSRVSLC